MVNSLRRFNRNRPPNAKAVILGVEDPLGPELTKVIEMLEYAGVIRVMGTVSKGVKGVFHRYELHYAVVLKRDRAGSSSKPVARRNGERLDLPRLSCLCER